MVRIVLAGNSNSEVEVLYGSTSLSESFHLIVPVIEGAAIFISNIQLIPTQPLPAGRWPAGAEAPEMDLEAQGRESTFTLCHAHLKKQFTP